MLNHATLFAECTNLCLHDYIFFQKFVFKYDRSWKSCKNRFLVSYGFCVTMPLSNIFASIVEGHQKVDFEEIATACTN